MKKYLLTFVVIFSLFFSSCKNTDKQIPAFSDNKTPANTLAPVVTIQPGSAETTPSPSPTPAAVVNTPAPSPESTPLPLPASPSGLDQKEKSWFFQPKDDGSPSGTPEDIKKLIKKYSAYYLGDTSKKEIYLTFDEGYENGYTAKILDVLKANNVQAAFFVVKPYVTSNKALIKRMVDEGHLVVNHSVNHPSMATITDQAKFNSELDGVEVAFEELTGKKMAKFFRPPMGKYSELSLYYTANRGYKTIFWSFAYEDWQTDKQPSHDYAKKLILQRTHNGAIILLHAVSKTNTDILDELIKEWKSRGYELKALDKLP